MRPHASGSAALLPPEGAECRGSTPAGAGVDGMRGRCVSQRRGLQGRAALGAARRAAR
ncbi:MAG: hypothetical protein LKCHEGNO_00285 [Burkholderiaceae bacterium]|nr:hypothetical protein [Burkholderiaceae bacterium]